MEKYNSNGPINIGSGIDLTISELAAKIATSVGFEGVIKWDVSKVDGTPQKVLDVQKISNLGWKPSISLDEGIRSTVEWYIENK
jgi:GDP-L-fucose synthase